MSVTGALAGPFDGAPSTATDAPWSVGPPKRPPVTAFRNARISSRLFCISCCEALSAAISSFSASVSFGDCADEALQPSSAQSDRTARSVRRESMREEYNTPGLREDLAGVEDAGRIERVLDPFHERDGVGRQLDRQEGGLGEPDAVLAADRAFERDDTLEERLLRHARASDLLFVVRVDHDVHVDVPISRVAEARDA